MSGPGQLQIFGRAPDRRAADFFAQRRPLHGGPAVIKTSITPIYAIGGSQGNGCVVLVNQQLAVEAGPLIV